MFSNCLFSMEFASLQKWYFLPFFDLLTDEKSLCKRLFIDSANIWNNWCETRYSISKEDLINWLIEAYVCCYSRFRSSRSQMFFKIGGLKNFTTSSGKYLCWSLLLIKLQASAPLLKKTQTQMFSCEYCQIFKNRFFIKHLWWLLLKITQWYFNTFHTFVEYSISTD